MRPRTAFSLGLLLCVALGVGAAPAAAQTWTLYGPVAEGSQIDALRGPNDHIHLVSSRYYQLDTAGTVLVDEAQGDAQQGSLDFPPALAVGSDGSAHLVTRQGGDWDNGHDIRYRRRTGAGAWDRDYTFGTPARRNYVVAAAWAGASAVYVSQSEALGNDVWGDLHLFSAGATSAAAVGDLSGLWRADTDMRMRGGGSRVYLVSGKVDPDGRVYFSWADAGAGLLADLTSHLVEHTGGTGRRGFPDLYVDATGQVHVTYGAQHEVYYQRYSATGQPQLASDVRVFDGLGDWHLSTGLSAVAAGDDGDTVVAVAIRSDGTSSISNGALQWAYSRDGGQTWSAPADLGWTTNAGEGRRRPRLVAVGQTFCLLFGDNAASGISLATVVLPADADGDGYGADVDCDDQNSAVHPGAPELCNGVDDDCDGTTDEGCPGPDGGVAVDAAPGADAGPAPDAASGADAAIPGDGAPGSDGGGGHGGASSGCACDSRRGGDVPRGAGWLVVLVVAALWRRGRSAFAQALLR